MKKLLLTLSFILLFLSACTKEENTVELHDFIIQDQDLSDKSTGLISIDNMDDFNFKIEAKFDENEFYASGQAVNGRMIENRDGDFIMYIVNLEKMEIAKQAIDVQNSNVSIVVFEDGYIAYRFKNADLDILLGFKN